MLKSNQEVAKSKEEIKPNGRGLVFIIGTLTAFGPFSLDMYLPGLPALTNDLKGETWQVQLTLTACLMGLAFGQVVAGPLSDSLGRKRPLLAGLAVYALASGLCAFAPSVPVLIGLRLLQGVAGATGIVIARAIVRDLYSGKDVARFFSLTMAVSGVAPIIAPVVGGQLLNFTTWRGVFGVLVILGLVLLATVTLSLKETLPPEKRRRGGLAATFESFRLLLTDRYFVGYALSSGLAFAAMFAYISGSPFVLEDIYKVSPQTFSFIFAANALGIVAASQINARLVKRVEPRKLMQSGLVGSVVGGLLLLVAVSVDLGLWGVLLGFFITVASIGFIAPNATALALANQAGLAGSASGLIGVMQYLIGALVAPLVSIGGTATDLPLVLVMAAASCTAFLIFLVLTRTGSKT